MGRKGARGSGWFRGGKISVRLAKHKRQGSNEVGKVEGPSEKAEEEVPGER